MDGLSKVLLVIFLVYVFLLLLSPILRARMLSALSRHHVSGVKHSHTESTSVAIGDVAEPGDPLSTGDSLSEMTVARTAANSVAAAAERVAAAPPDVPLHLDAAVSSPGDRVAAEIARRQSPENEGRHTNAPPSALYSFHKDNIATKADPSVRYV